MEFALNVFYLKCQYSLCTLGYLFIVLFFNGGYKILGDIYYAIH
ncbi:rCG51160 [Rattus norvegicus]|uniref:RCG51160 n=1 Tax=Rattus norvegicus TaxID=10116 RepID=A6IZC6_RAT|nr:rCG51160 [Rattus norvegicus]